MRLLDTTTKQLRTFYGEKIPKYAILSHMWGREEDEVLFRHIAGSDADRREGEMRKGYAKVEGACRQAVEDGWKYIWIDTCCIDKTSSAELSEAINSMYEWYQNSEVCYVYLEDVRSDREPDGDGDGELDSNKAEERDSTKEEGGDEDGEPEKFQIVPFERSRWFKRGWTLQELIAPQFVVFYSKGWIDIGTKASLQETISTVTRIRVEMLIAYDPEKASVAEKMSWAAFRKTTRVEDIAYCLMGLLGVNMPLLYGEGNRAFRRLQEELMKVSDDDSLFAWKGHFKKHNNYLNNTCGMLAASPWDFRDGTNIVRSQDGAYSPYSMTNQGLQIKLPLLHINPNLEHHPFDIDSSVVFKTTLKCTVRDSAPIQWIVIYLKKVGEGQYQRISPHWLDEIETRYRDGELNLLLVPQASTFPTRHHGGTEGIRIKILPTESGFTMNDHGLVKGYEYSVRDESPYHEIISFKHQEKCFGVAIGLDGGIPWLDFIDVIDEKQSYDNPYKKGGSRASLQEQRLDRLCKKIPGVGWVTVSVKRTGHDPKHRFLTLVSIQGESIQAKGWYNPPVNSTNDSPSVTDTPFAYIVNSWIAIPDIKVERELKVSLAYTLPPERVTCMQVSCDGKYLATSVNLGNVEKYISSLRKYVHCDKVQVYNMKTGAKICTFIDEVADELTNKRTDEYRRTSICFSLDGKFIAIAYSDRDYIKIWDIGAKCVHKVLNGHGGIQSFRFLQSSPSSHLLISQECTTVYSPSITIRIWEIANGTSRIFTPLRENPSYPSYLPITVSPDGNLVVVEGRDGFIQIWDMVTTQLLGELSEESGYYMGVAFTPDGKGLILTSRLHGNVLNYWDISGLFYTGVKRILDDPSGSDSKASSVLVRGDVRNIGQPTRTFNITKSYSPDTIDSFAISHDGRWVISGVQGDRMVFWDLNDAAPRLLFVIKDRPYPWPYSRLKFDVMIDTSQTSNMFATCVRNGNWPVQVWRYDNIKPEGNPSPYVST